MGNSGSRSTVFGRNLRTTSSTNEPVKSNLAPTQMKSSDDLETDSECPICFYNYEALNTTKCCKGNICTTCHLDIISINKTAKPTTCPFCSSTSYCVTFSSTGVITHMKSPNSTPVYGSSSPMQPTTTTVDLSGPRQIESSNPTYNSKRSSIARSLPIVLASVDDRNQIENEIRSQRRESGSNRNLNAVARSLESNSSRSFSHSCESPPLSMLPSPHRTGPSTAQNYSHNENSNNTQPESTTNEQQQINAFQSFLRAFINGNNPNLQGANMEGYDDVERLEQLMLLQAIQMSLNDASTSSPSPALDPIVEPRLSQLNANDSSSSSSIDINSHESTNRSALDPRPGCELKHGEYFENLIQDSVHNTDTQEINNRECKNELEHTDMWRPFDMDECFSHQPSSDQFATQSESLHFSIGDLTQDTYISLNSLSTQSAGEINNSLLVPDLDNDSARGDADVNLKPAAIITPRSDYANSINNEDPFYPTAPDSTSTLHAELTSAHQLPSAPFILTTEEFEANDETKPTKADTVVYNTTTYNISFKKSTSFSNSNVSAIERGVDESFHSVVQSVKKAYPESGQESYDKSDEFVDPLINNSKTAVIWNKVDKDDHVNGTIMKDSEANSSFNGVQEAFDAMEYKLSLVEYPVSQNNVTTNVSDSVAAELVHTNTGTIGDTASASDSAAAVVDCPNTSIIEATTTVSDSVAASIDQPKTYTDQNDLLVP